ncbi:OmpP1/FadL family transporter [Azospirillum argentinense]
MRVIAAFAAAATLAAAFPSHATDVYTFEGFGAVSMGMGGTGAASDIGGAAMIFNPATLTQRSSSYLEGGLVVAAPTGLRATQTRTGEVAHGKDTFPFQGYYIPQGGFVWRHEALALGLGAYAQGGFGTEYGEGSFMARLPSGVDSGLRTGSEAMFMRVPLAAAWDVTPKVTVAGAIDYVRAGLGFRVLQGADQLGALAATGRLTGQGPMLGAASAMVGMGGGVYFDIFDPSIARAGVEGDGVSGRLGLTWKPQADTTVGAFYQFRTALNNLTGDGSVIVLAPDGSRLTQPAKYTLGNFQLPAEFGIGVSHRLRPDLTVAFDYRRAFWAQALRQYNIRVDVPGLGTVWETLPQRYRDINIFAVGGAYQVTDALTLRAGFRWADKIAPAQDIVSVIPVVITKHASVGVGYAFSETLRLDGAYSHGFQECVSNSTPPNGSAVNPGKFCNGTDIVALSLSASF